LRRNRFERPPVGVTSTSQ